MLSSADVSTDRQWRWLHRFWIPSVPTSGVARYGCALIAFTVTFLCRFGLEPLLGTHAPLLLFTLPVVVSAEWGGLGPGLFATALGAAAGWAFLPPDGQVAMSATSVRTGVYQTVLFLMAGAGMSWLGGALRQIRRQAEEYARARNEILESITDGFAAFDREDRLVYVNGAAERMIGAHRAELLGKLLRDVFSEARPSLIEEALREVSERGVAVHQEMYYEPWDKWFDLHAYPTKAGGASVYFSDITDRKLADSQLRETLERLNAALERVRLLTGLLPICASCKRIRDENGDWQQMELYISRHSEASFTHGICPACMPAFFPENEPAPHRTNSLPGP